MVDICEKELLESGWKEPFKSFAAKIADKASPKLEIFWIFNTS